MSKRERLVRIRLSEAELLELDALAEQLTEGNLSALVRLLARRASVDTTWVQRGHNPTRERGDES